MKRAKTTTSLHKLQPIPAPEIQIPTQRKKDSLVSLFSSHKTPMKHRNETSNLNLEIIRMKSIDNLSNCLKKECEKLGKIPPIYAFERLLAVSLLTSKDSLVPSINHDCNGLITDLSRIGINKTDSLEIIKKLKTCSKTCLENIKHAETIPDKNTVSIIRHKHSIDVIISSLPKMILKLTHLHLMKLETLYKMNTCSTTNVLLDDPIFLFRLACLLLRYKTLGGDGFQAACSNGVFEVLQKYYNVNHECFASSLNCTFSNYCSGFNDVDSYFGSQGSFFDFDFIQGGSFEANPPFIPEIMDKMVQIIHRNLNSVSSSLSFIVIVPIWLESQAFIDLSNSKYLKHSISIPKSAHAFTDGAQYKRRDRYRESPFDTMVFILQNDKGFAEFPSSKQFEAELLLAFKTCIPTVIERKRRLKEGRGLGDLDGGGGVFKGKKSKRKSL